MSTFQSVIVTRDGWLRGMGQISSVSMQGAILSTALRMPAHASITVALTDCIGEVGEIPACVVRAQAGGVAIEWRNSTSPQVKALIDSMSPNGSGLGLHGSCAA